MTDSQKNAQSRTESMLRANMRLSTIEGIVAMPIVFMSTTGNFIMANLSTETLGMSNATYGIIASLPAWCNVLQLILVPILSKVWAPKTISLGFSWFHLATWVLLGFSLPYLPRDGSWPTVLFMLTIYGVASLTFAIISISWTAWVQEWLPTKARGKYLGRRNRFAQGSAVLFLILGGLCIKHFSKSDAIIGFQILIGVGVVLRILSIVWQQRIYSLGEIESKKTDSLRAQFKIIFSNQALTRFILFGAAFNLFANMIGPFFPVFMFKTLNIGMDQIGFIITLSTITGALSMPQWGELCDKYGCRPTIAIALIFWMLNGYFWTFSTPDRVWIAYLCYGIGGIFGAGFIFSSFNMLLKLVPPNAKTATISVNLAISSIAGAITPIIGGNLIQWAENRFEDNLAVFHVFANIHHTLILLTVFILLTVKEPKSSTLLQAAGAMRSFRQVGALLGLSFLVNYSFFNKKKNR